MKKLFIILTIVLAGLIYALNATNPVTKLKKNKNLELVCGFQDGYREIPKNKIISYDSGRDMWIFTNGYAHNCSIENTTK